MTARVACSVDSARYCGADMIQYLPHDHFFHCLKAPSTSVSAAMTWAAAALGFLTDGAPLLGMQWVIGWQGLPGLPTGWLGWSCEQQAARTKRIGQALHDGNGEGCGPIPDCSRVAGEVIAEEFAGRQVVI